MGILDPEGYIFFKNISHTQDHHVSLNPQKITFYEVFTT